MTATFNPFGPFVDSYNRMELVIAQLERMPSLEWFTMLGDAWPSCDNIWRHRAYLRHALAGASRPELDAMMTPEERTAHAALPARVAVWRGCYMVNRAGLSWTTDAEVARRIVTLHRYRRAQDVPLLRAGTVRADRVVLKLDRGESEIIAAHVFGIVERALVQA